MLVFSFLHHASSSHHFLPDIFEAVAFLVAFHQVNLLKLNDFQGLAYGFSLVGVQQESVSDAFDFAEAFDDGVDALGHDSVADDEQVVEVRAEIEQHLVLAFDGNKVVDKAVFACRIVVERKTGTVGENVLLPRKVDGELLVDQPCQLVID